MAMFDHLARFQEAALMRERVAACFAAFVTTAGAIAYVVLHAVRELRDRERALATARESGLDLVEISPSAVPPVCKLMDYGKYKYEQKKKAAASKAASLLSHFAEDQAELRLVVVALVEPEVQPTRKPVHRHHQRDKGVLRGKGGLFGHDEGLSNRFPTEFIDPDRAGQ